MPIQPTKGERVADETTVEVAYDGPALTQGRMDVRDLAPALLGLGDLLQAANRELNGEAATLRAEVKSDFKTGSFAFDLAILVATNTVMFAPETIHSAKQIAEWVGLIKSGATSLIDLVKALKGKKPEPESVVNNGDGTVSISGINNKVAVTVIKLYESPVVREALQKTVEPLKKQGITELKVRDRHRRSVPIVTTEDVGLFESPGPFPWAIETALTQPADDTRTLYVEIIRAAFRPHMRWRVSDGSVRLSVLIKDAAFWERVDSGELTFAKGQHMQVRLKSSQRRTPEGLHADHEIVEVIQVLPMMRQTRLIDLE